MSTSEGIIAQLGKSPWYYAFLASTLLLGLLMLFFKELTSPLRDYLVPAFTVYALGTAIIGHIQAVEFRKNGNKKVKDANGIEKNWDEPTKRYAVAHVILFFLLFCYLFYRGVI